MPAPLGRPTHVPINDGAEVIELLANVKALAQMGRGGASIAGKSHKLRDAPITRPPHLLSSSDLFCSSNFSGGGESTGRMTEQPKPI
jgi:hypothetical protein